MPVDCLRASKQVTLGYSSFKNKLVVFCLFKCFECEVLIFMLKAELKKSDIFRDEKMIKIIYLVTNICSS